MAGRKSQQIPKEKEGLVWLVYFGVFYLLAWFGDVIAEWFEVVGNHRDGLYVGGFKLVTGKMLIGIFRALRPLLSALIMIWINQKIDALKKRFWTNIFLLIFIVGIGVRIFLYSSPMKDLFHSDQDTIAQG